MNQTLKGGLVRVESAFDFIKDQVDRHAHAQVKRLARNRTLAKNIFITSLAVLLAFATVLPTPVIVTDTVAIKSTPESAFTSSIRLDKDSPTLLVIEEKKIEIKHGKSLAQETAAARLRQIAKQTNPTVVAITLSTSEAHRLAQEAANKAGIPDHWKELAAIWQVESGKAMSTCVVSKADGRAVGPMQFMHGTFRAYAADGDGDGKADICNAKDALVAAGNLLKRGGIADGNVDGAIHNYNHSGAYVKKVRNIANSIK